MIDGLWTVVFRAGQVSSGGVVVLQSGRAMGGDCWYYYVGSYTLDNAQIKAKLHVKAFVPNAVTVFGMAAGEFDLDIVGTVANNEISAVGTTPLYSSLRLQMKMVRRAGGSPFQT